MNFNEGLNRLRKHLPEARTAWGMVRLLALPVILFLLVTQLFATSDMFGEVWLLDAEVLTLTAGFLMLYLFFWLKGPLKERYGEDAFAMGFKRFVAPGLAIIFAVVARVPFIGGPMIPGWILDPAGWLLGWLLIIVGVLLWLRAVLALGMDSLTMTYVYYPVEGLLKESSIYGLLRHPIYGAVQRISLGLALLNGSWIALTLAFIICLYTWGWVRLVEERELIGRFGRSYEDYRKKVSAFWPKWRRLGKFIQFLIQGR